MRPLVRNLKNQNAYLSLLSLARLNGQFFLAH